MTHRVLPVLFLPLALAACGEGPPTRPSNDIVFTAVSAGGDHTCALDSSGTAYCWGDNHTGQLGTGSAGPGSFHASAAPVAGALRFRSISAGGLHTCALGSRGEAYCWGHNFYGQLGDGSTMATLTPVLVTSDRSFTALDAGTWHTCALTREGATYCWGYHHFRQLGMEAGSEHCGLWACATRPVRIAEAPALVALTTGGLQACGLTASADAYCWGSNFAGELGGGTLADEGSAAPVRVLGTIAWRSITGGEHHECGVSSTSTVFCWGSNSYGQLGNGEAGAGVLRASPVPVAADLRFADVSAGMRHTCGITTGGSLYCWGDNRSGQIGDGTLVARVTPTRVLDP